MGAFSRSRYGNINLLLSEVACFGPKNTLSGTSSTVRLLFGDDQVIELVYKVSRLIHVYDGGFSWGEDNQGTDDFALNLLFTLTGDRDFAFRNYRAIVKEFLLPLPKGEDCIFQAQPLIARVEALWVAELEELRKKSYKVLLV